MALPMTLVIIAGEIDLSVESMAGLACAVLGFLWAAGVPIGVAIPLVARGWARSAACSTACSSRGCGLPSLVVTLGTLALYPRARADRARPAGRQRLPGLVHDASASGTCPGTPDPVAVRDLRRAGRRPRRRPPRGRGSGARSTPSARTPSAARYSGVRVARHASSRLFVLSGTIAALAGVILTARLVERAGRRRRRA